MWQTSLRVKYCVLLILAIWFGNGTLCQAQGKDAEIKELNKKQEQLLDEALEDLSARWDSGADREEVLQAIEQVLKAKLHLAATPKERVVVLQKLLQNADRASRLLEASFNVGKAKTYQLLQARAQVFERRAQLLREEQNLDKKKE